MDYIIFTVLGLLIIGCTKKEVGTAEIVHPAYGAAYMRFTSLTGVCYPIPFNIIIGLLYRCWLYLRSPKFIKYTEEDSGRPEVPQTPHAAIDAKLDAILDLATRLRDQNNGSSN